LIVYRERARKQGQGARCWGAGMSQRTHRLSDMVSLAKSVYERREGGEAGSGIEGRRD